MDKLTEQLREKKLSKREIEVATVVAKGVTNRQAANQLFIVEKTIKYHLTNIYKKLCIKSREHLIVTCDKMERQPDTID